MKKKKKKKKKKKEVRAKVEGKKIKMVHTSHMTVDR
jgi:hypothetical protein